MLTIEQAAIECANTYVKGYRDSYPANEGDFIDVFESGVEFAQRWISVEEELPKMCEQVLVKMLINDTIHYRCASIFYCENGVKLWSASGHFYPCRNTWWRPIELK